MKWKPYYPSFLVMFVFLVTVNLLARGFGLAVFSLLGMAFIAVLMIILDYQLFMDEDE